MQITAKLNNLRMASRKVRLVTNLIRRMDAKTARVQLQFMNKKAAQVILKLLNSGIANAKQNFNLNEDNLYISKLVVEGGTSLKRWLPRAMGRATPILKRTCSIALVLEEKVTKGGQAAPKARKETKKATEEARPIVGKEETISAFEPEREEKAKPAFVPKPYDSSSQSKKRFFSRQTFRKIFRRKSI